MNRCLSIAQSPVASLRYETATLVEHTTGVPLASLNFHDHNGELAAVGALLEVVPISGALLTLDALHTTRDTAASIVEQHGADYLLTVKKNCPETYEALATMPWEQATGRFSEDPEKGHGRIDRRHIEVLTPPNKTINYPHVAQVFRVRRERTDIKSDAKSMKPMHRHRPPAGFFGPGNRALSLRSSLACAAGTACTGPLGPIGASSPSRYPYGIRLMTATPGSCYPYGIRINIATRGHLPRGPLFRASLCPPHGRRRRVSGESATSVPQLRYAAADRSYR